ncbi:CAP domain-containing protein, partial [Kitasatospora putterlickiae]|uniref:CAP domain-containing protein n=1 Tax=Kitasatospora putterlickiae TaxID=221725 RepID=UPI0031D144D4
AAASPIAEAPATEARPPVPGPSTTPPVVAAPAPADTRATATSAAVTPTASPSSARPSATPVGAGNLERQLVDLVNTERARRGCAPLRIDPRLHAAAQRHSEDMVARSYFGHDAPGGGQADARLSAAGYRWSQWGENLDRGPSAPAVVFSRWMDGGIHQTNMLDCAFKDVGVGVATGPGGLYWTQDLGTPLG